MLQRMMLVRILAATTLIMASACGGGQPRTSAALAALPPLADAPYELAYDQDLEDALDRYRALAPSDPERAALRRSLADEYARRVHASMQSPELRDAGPEALMAMASLWTPAELVQGPTDMARYQDAARAVRDVFARSGGDLEAAGALFFLAAADPAHEREYLAEIDDIFTYADDLAMASFGEGARHARPIEILEATIRALPSPAVVDRLLERHPARQALIARYVRQQGMNKDLLQAHGAGMFRTTQDMVGALARAERLAEAPAALAGIDGPGDSKELRDALTAALREDSTPEDWLALIRALVGGKVDTVDAEVALSVHAEASRRHPDSAALWFAAAERARGLDRQQQAIVFYQRGLALEPGHRDAAESLAELYRFRVSTLAFAERPHAARKQLDVLEAFLAKARARWPEQPLASDHATALAAMGRGMVGLGQLDQAETYLQRSLALRPTYEALEYLGMVALKQDRFAQALAYFEQALRVPAREVIDQFERAKILRLSGDALAGLGQTRRARDRWGQTIDAWMELVQSVDLPPRFQAELLIEAAKAQWAMGDRELCLRALETAVDVDPDGGDTYTSVVSFLIPRGYYERALDAYYRALGSYQVGDYAKVYLSLWVLAEAGRRGDPPDPLAQEYLASRDGRLWYDALARFAIGRDTPDTLEQRATTRGRLAELWYYTAVLGARGDTQERHQLLRRVLATDMVLFFEYDMAKYWLANEEDGLQPVAP